MGELICTKANTKPKPVFGNWKLRIWNMACEHLNLQFLWTHSNSVKCFLNEEANENDFYRQEFLILLSFYCIIFRWKLCSAWKCVSIGWWNCCLNVSTNTCLSAHWRPLKCFIIFWCLQKSLILHMSATNIRLSHNIL